MTASAKPADAAGLKIPRWFMVTIVAALAIAKPAYEVGEATAEHFSKVDRIDRRMCRLEAKLAPPADVSCGATMIDTVRVTGRLAPVRG